MSMSCEAVRQSVVWFLDDELESETFLEVEEHLQGCRDCREFLEYECCFRETLRQACRSTPCPDSLRNSVRSMVATEKRVQALWHRAVPAVAAAAILLAFIWQGTTGGLEPEFEEVARRHARDLPMDIVAADGSQLQLVQNYFKGKLPFAVRLPEVGEQIRVQRLGGRITHLGNRDAAYVRYELPTGRMSMFVYEDNRGQEISEVTPMYRFGDRRIMLKRMRGYTVAKWRAGGLVYSMVTDVPERELSMLLGNSALWQGPAASAP